MSDFKSIYDVIVIGAGPAGYVAAIRAAQLGLQVACIDNWKNNQGESSLGGTYVNAGSIPSVALLESSKIFHSLKEDAEKHGIEISGLSLDVKKMIQRKDQVVNDLSNQIKDSFKYHNIDNIHGDATLLNATKVEVVLCENDEKHILETKNVILATGSKSVDVACAKIDNELILDSKATLDMAEVPKRLGIIGAGIIGLELGGIWNRLGSKVILLEAQENFLMTPDFQISDEAYKLYCEQGLDLRLGARVMSTKIVDGKVIVDYQDLKGKHRITLDKLIVATGRRPNTEFLAIAEANLLLNESGFIHVDEECCTNLPNVYAIGDLTLLGSMLAHKGLEEGVFVAERIAAGECTPVDYNVIPCVIYTEPEIAWVGQTEQALKAVNEPYKVGVFSLNTTGRGRTINKTSGMVKILSHAETDKILGIHIIGTRASELIAEAVLAMVFSASSEDLARTIHAHPSISEALQGAALNLDNRSVFTS
ncbi:MAG: dihydrolipoyl dehydrogenase [Methylococcales bacterium]|nr:dihydrolipoyl dehydrogenase [Methylococcales bacterium]